MHSAPIKNPLNTQTTAKKKNSGAFLKELNSVLFKIHYNATAGKRREREKKKEGEKT